MSRKIRISTSILLITILLTLSPTLFSPARAQNPIAFTAAEIDNHFTDELVFRVTVTSTGAEIVSAKFAFTNEGLYGSRSYTKDPIDFTPGQTVDLAYTLDTRDLTTPPLMTYLYHWEVVDADGNKYQSEEFLIRYDDNRYDWHTLGNEVIGVWWHDRPESFGQTIFDIAEEAVTYQQALFNTDLDFQIKIVISNTPEEFNSWHTIGHDWIGGQTFNNFGITNQIVEGEYYQDAWLNGVIPHEISHIFFNHVVYNPTVSVPVWINEGVAQYNEFISHEWEMDRVKAAAADGSLVPLVALEDGFGSYDVERIYLSYAEAYSAAAYLVETYGNEGLSDLLAAYKNGKTTDEAFQTALGISIDQFEMDWAGSVGAENYTLPTAWAIPTFLPSPTAYILADQGTSVPAETSTVTPCPPIVKSSQKVNGGLSTPATTMPILSVAAGITVLSIGVLAGSYFLIKQKGSQVNKELVDDE